MRNTGKVELIACLDDVIAMIESGYNLANVHAEMVKKKKFTMSYATLCYHMRKHNKPSSPAFQKNSTIPPVKPVNSISKTGFLRPEEVDVKGLF